MHDFCENYKVIVFFFIPYTNHLLQLLDVGVFQAYTYWHSGAVANALYSRGEHLQKPSFFMRSI
jgi:hypothetical protein